MNSNVFLHSLRLLLWPFSLLFALVLWVRNKLYDAGILKSAPFGLPLICVGNLSVGGTGKSPMVEYLTRLLKDDFKIAVLSRGYKRKTRGYALANAASTAIDIGDEPLQFHKKFPGVPVAVGEERIVGIAQLLHDHPETEAIILDDAFQHRAVKAGLNLLLTDCSHLFTNDFYLPTGDLRDLKSSYKRAQIIIVTKCKAAMNDAEKVAVIEKIKPLPHQHLFFSTIDYGRPYHIYNKQEMVLNKATDVLLVTGIANPRPLETFLKVHAGAHEIMHFGDHHIFTLDDWKSIKKRFAAITNGQKIILTTEKDSMRLLKYAAELNDLQLFVIPMQPRILFGAAEQFKHLVTTFITDFKPLNTANGKKQ